MILLLDVKISDDINSPSTSCTAARLLVESRRLKLKPLFIFLKERQSHKSEKIQIEGLYPFLTKFMILKKSMEERANYLSATGGVLLLEPDPIVNFQLTAHSPNPGTQLRA